MFLQNEPIASWDRIVCVSRTESPRTATDDAAVRELRSASFAAAAPALPSIAVHYCNT
jgi:hypothetical protein